ncbi:hypothetical protein LOTGIDRAFT_235071 [Lottia gigantea]|uniref:Peptidase M12B domain-containing protein n=1 Tax=Lottia gigantea TaxID=225164 RepID=V4BFD8_LOTGI|nr:hypothetical protein LOTGIDRAFT_235071 [Lottia gigantea]ESO87624.1 hypothetical protein LOTGIDRAFT_235071 [Lottia gigantea]
MAVKLGPGWCGSIVNATIPFCSITTPGGIGYVKGACISSRKYAKSTYDVAVSEIGKSFKGVLVSAHEVGHLIGAYHDGVDEAADCPKNSGFIMSYTRHNASMFSRFSECSKRSIRHFLSKIWYSKCLRETSDAGYTYPELLPGQYMPISDQCREYSNGFPCPSQSAEERCQKLCCENNVYRIFRREPAVDGTKCGLGMMCMNGACIPSSKLKVLPWI